MNPLPDNLNKVQRLLRWKRHEQPPPGYFNGFSSKVLARIETEKLYAPTAWWSRWLAQFDAKPVLICAYGLVVCSSFFFGLSFHDLNENASTVNLATSQNVWLSSPPMAVTASPHEVLPVPLSLGLILRGNTEQPHSYLSDGSQIAVQNASFLFRQR